MRLIKKFCLLSCPLTIPLAQSSQYSRCTAASLVPANPEKPLLEETHFRRTSDLFVFLIGRNNPLDQESDDY